MTSYTSRGIPIIDKTDKIASNAAGENLRENINAVGTATTVALDAETARTNTALVAEAARADAASREVVDNAFDSRNVDQRLPTLSDGDMRHSWRDPRGRIALYSRPDGIVVAPLPLETPRAGLPTLPGMPYSWISSFDASTGTYPELLLGLDGAVPQWVLNRWASRMNIAPSPGAGATRRAGVALTLSGGGFTDTATAVQLRWPFKIAAAVQRFRIHLRNHNDRDSLAYAGALSVTGIWVGAHGVATDGTLTGAWASTPKQVSGAFTTSDTGGEYVTGWIERSTAALDGYTEHLISLGYTCAAQTNHAGVAGCWRSAVPGEAASMSPGTALTRAALSPLDVWVEVEIDADVPVGAYLGDSLTVGTGATMPVYDSYASRHALAHGVVPQIMAHHGSQMSNWTNASAWKWAKYAGLSKPDSVLWALGGNDIGSPGMDLATAKTRFLTLAAVVRLQLCGTIYLANLMPRTGSTDFNTLRALYNVWLETLPAGAVNCFDFSTPVQQPGNADLLLTRFDSDGTHLNTAGYAANARSITAPLAHVH